MRTATASSSRTSQYADALTTADRLVFFRYMVHILAHEAGMAATFMPKPFAHLTGNGLHTHQSRLGRGQRVVPETEDDPRGLGSLRDGLRLHRRPDRARPGDGGGHVPDRELLQADGGRGTHLGSYLGPGLRNLRIEQPDPDAAHARRRSDREPGVDGAANPYLAFTVQLAAGLDGIERNSTQASPTPTISTHWIRK